MGEPTIIELDDAQAALVMYPDGAVEVYMPDQEDHEAPMPDHVVWTVALAALMQDEEWVRYTWYKWGPLAEKLGESE